MLEIYSIKQIQNSLKEKMHEIIWVKENLYTIDRGFIIFLV
jgi:hypothetical protein